MTAPTTNVTIGSYADFWPPSTGTLMGGQFLILPDNMQPCGKNWFLSKTEAERQMQSMKPIKGPEFRLNAYYCFGCDGWHIGHTRIKERE